MPVTFDVFPGSVADAPRIAEMSRRLIEVNLPWTWTPGRVRRHIRYPDSVVLTARVNDRDTPTDLKPGKACLAGCAIMHFGEDIAHLNLLAVEPLWQHLGLGSRLLHWLEKSAVTAEFSACAWKSGRKTRTRCSL